MKGFRHARKQRKTLWFRGALVIPDACPPDEVMAPEESIETDLSKVSINPKLSVEQQKELRTLVSEFSDIFKLNPSPDTRTHGVMHQIELQPGTKPISCKPFPMSPFLHDEVKKVTDVLLKAGMIRPGSGPWAFPVVMVRKPGGKNWRMCVDFRKLNEVTVKDKWPLPRIQDLHHSLRGSKIFSTMDALCGFWQVLVDPRDRAKTAFITRHGLFEWNVMPMGLCNSPATFQRLMESTLSGLLHRFCLCYIDDVCAHSHTFAEHLEHLRQIFVRFRRNRIALKPSKCHFGFGQLKFLGWIASGEGIRPNPEKVEAILEFGRPQKLKELRSFLGMASWFRDSVRNFATLAAPLSDLLKGRTKGARVRKLVWTKEARQAFESIKNEMAKQTMLHHPDPSKPFFVDCDASDVGVGAVLFQLGEDGKEKPIVFASRSLTEPERKWDASEKEAFAVIWALREKLRPFLMGHSHGFTVFTDHANLLFLLRQRKGKLARWGLTLAEFQNDMKIVHKKGSKNLVADALSRDPRFFVEQPSETIACAQVKAPFSVQALKEAQRKDSFWSQIIGCLEDAHAQSGQSSLAAAPRQFSEKAVNASKHHVLDDEGVLRCTSAPSFLHFDAAEAPICLPTEFREDIIKEHHGVTHDGVNRMHASISERFWWKGMRKQIQAHVRKCELCQKAKATVRRRAHLIRPKQFRKPWDVVGIDVFGPLPVTSKGNRNVLTIVDAFTRFTVILAMKTVTAKDVCEALKAVFCTFGFPRVIHSDRGSQFTSELFGHVCERLNVKHTKTPPWHPQGNGHTERFHRFLKARLRIHLHQAGKEWDAWLGPIMLSHNQGVLSTTRFSPFQLTFGRSPNFTPTDLSNSVAEQSRDLALFGEEMVSIFQHSWQKAREDFRWAKEQQAIAANAPKPAHTQTQFEVGDLVLIHQPRRSDARRKLSRKLQFEWRGPLRIVERLNPTVFKLVDVKSGKEHDAVHVDRLSLFVGDSAAEVHSTPASSPEMPGPLQEGEIVVVSTNMGLFPARVFDTPMEDDELVSIHWFNTHSKRSLPVPKRRWKEVHVDPGDGKCVFTNRPPAHFEPEQGLVARRKVIMRHLKLRKDGTFDSDSTKRFQEAKQRL